MFESDQHEFDEEYAEISHPAPPSPQPAPKPAAPATMTSPAATFTAATTAHTRVAPEPMATTTVTTALPEPEVPAPVVAQTPAMMAAPATTATTTAGKDPVEEDQETAAYKEPAQEEFADPAERPVLPPRKKKPNLMLIGGVAALVMFGLFVVLSMRSKSSATPPGDMGPGIVAVAGLRGHLDTRWEGDTKTGKLVYQLRIEPMEDRWGKGFSKVTSEPPIPIAVNVRLLDAAGFALCGKEIDFRFNPQQHAGALMPASLTQVGGNGKKLSLVERTASMQNAVAQMQAAEMTREQGKDIFQNQTTDEGQVSAVHAQGMLPCSPDQFKRADYWDFSTNFPTLEQQAFLVDPKAAMRAREFEAPDHAGKRTLVKWGNGFVIQGDDRITGYDSAHGVLWAQEKTFAIDKRYGQTTATEWANNYSLIHYRCDQHASCALTAAGQAAVLHARLNE
jgi:hypothetical protein